MVFRQGMSCKAELPPTLGAPDPNYEKGFNAGTASAIVKFC
ncbi:hypothetical protein [Streptomyces sp. BE133]|nr:hypothetical protein [Streptomyces sp. BE133]MEE1808063.1 hypothetical protein [Streptomyces sp. BE133]